MSRLQKNIRTAVRQGNRIPARVIEVSTSGQATVSLSRTGTVYKGLPIVGGPVEVNQIVWVDFTTTIPTITAPSTKYIPPPSTAKALARIRKGIPPEVTVEGKTYWNPFTEQAIMGVYTMMDGYGGITQTDSIPNTPGEDTYSPDLTSGYYEFIGNQDWIVLAGKRQSSETDHKVINLNSLAMTEFTTSNGATVEGNNFAMDHAGLIYFVDDNGGTTNWRLYRYNPTTAEKVQLYDTGLTRTDLPDYWDLRPIGTVLCGRYIVSAFAGIQLSNPNIYWLCWDPLALAGAQSSKSISDLFPHVGVLHAAMCPFGSEKVGVILCAIGSDLGIAVDYNGFTGIVITPATNTATDYATAIWTDSGYNPQNVNAVQGDGNAGYVRGGDYDTECIATLTSAGALSVVPIYSSSSSLVQNKLVLWQNLLYAVEITDANVLRLRQLSNQQLYSRTLSLGATYTVVFSPLVSDLGDWWFTTYSGSGTSTLHRWNLSTGVHVTVSTSGMGETFAVDQIGGRVAIYANHPTSGKTLLLLR